MKLHLFSYTSLFFVCILFFSCKTSKPISTDGMDTTDNNYTETTAKPVSLDLSPTRKVPKPSKKGTNETAYNSGVLPKDNTPEINKKTTEQILPASPSLKNSHNEKIEGLINEMSLANTAIEEAQGYKLQVYSGSDRLEAEKTLKKLKSWVPASDQPILVYEQPNYKIKLGNFTNKLDAYYKYQVLVKEFPTILIVTDLINMEQLRKKYQQN